MSSPHVHDSETEPSRWPGIALALLAALASFRSIANSDFWLHLTAGREVAAQGIQRIDPLSFVTEGADWVHTTWLYDWALYRLWLLAGAPGVVLVHSLLAACAFALIAWTARGRATSILLAGLLVIWIANPALAARPSLPALAMTAAALALFSSGASFKRLALTLTPLQVVWANTHNSFLLLPLIALLTALDAALAVHQRPRRPSVLPAASYLTLAAILILASLLNPYGVQAPIQAVHEFVIPAQSWMLEWISPFSGLFPQAGLRAIIPATLLIMALGFILHLGRLPVLPTMLGIAGAFLLIRSPQHAEWAAALALPFLILSCEALDRELRKRLPAAAAGPFAAALALGIAGAYAATLVNTANSANLRSMGSAARFGWGVERDLFPLDAAASILTRAGFPDSIYNLPIDGGALHWEQRQKIFCDARTPVYGLSFYRDFNLALRGDTNRWAHLTARWPPDAFVFNCCWSGSGSMIRSLLISRKWALVYFDGSSAVLLPALRRTRHWLGRTDVQQAGLNALAAAHSQYAAAVDAGRHPPNPPRLIGAASFLQSVGRFTEAAQLYELLLRGSPEMTSAWLNWGICLVQSGRSADALPVLERAGKELPRNVMVPLWLGRACRETGDQIRAEQLQKKALKMDRAVAEAFASIAGQQLAAPDPAVSEPLRD